MPCEWITLPGGIRAHINRARRRKCFYCPKEHDVLCDGITADGRKTCDRPCCRSHAKNIGPNKDLCRDCAIEAATGKKRRLAL